LRAAGCRLGDGDDFVVVGDDADGVVGVEALDEEGGGFCMRKCEGV
jgi:hypothetical protein